MAAHATGTAATAAAPPAWPYRSGLALRDLNPLLQPRSIAVVGASDRAGSFGGQVIRNLVEMGFSGRVYAVHPRLTELFGRPCYPSLAALPESPECVALAVANHHLLGLLEQAAARRIAAAIIFGDPNVGAGRAPELQERITAFAQREDIAICGPNAMGVYALHYRLAISGYPVRPDLPAGNIALITHSGTVFDAMSQNDRGVAFNYVISCGNEAVLSTADYLHHVLGDPTTRVVALYLETVRDPERFMAGLRTAAMQRIPVVALKVGSSEKGRAMAQAHTGALAGGDEAYVALFRRFGVRQVRSLDEMMDTLELLATVRSTRGRGLSVLMESGGERSLVADLSQGLDFTFTELAEPTRRALAAALDEGVVPDNPLDAFGTGHDVVGVYSACLRAMDADPGTGLLLLAVDLARDSSLSPAYVEAALRTREALVNPLVAMVNLSAGASPPLMAKLRAAKVPVLMGTETGLRAIHHLVGYQRFVERTEQAPTLIGTPEARELDRWRTRIGESTEPLDEHTSKQLLAAYGIEVTRERIVDAEQEAAAAARDIGYPVALKTAAPHVLHKSDAGGVCLSLPDAPSLAGAYRALAAKFGSRALVQEMSEPGSELILGMKLDPQIGPVMLLGLGGLLVEVYRDVVTCLPPLAAGEVEGLLRMLRGYPLLEGARGRPRVDMSVLVDTVLRFATFCHDLGDLLSEVDVNPLIATASRALVVDALMIPKRIASGAERGLASHKAHEEAEGNEHHTGDRELDGKVP